MGEHGSIKQGVYVGRPPAPAHLLLNVLLYLREYLVASFRTGFSQLGSVLLSASLRRSFLSICKDSALEMMGFTAYSFCVPPYLVRARRAAAATDTQVATELNGCLPPAPRKNQPSRSALRAVKSFDELDKLTGFSDTQLQIALERVVERINRAEV